MSELTREKVEAWRDLGAAYVEHMPDGDAMFTALCDMALESITLKLEPGACAAVAELADLKQRLLPQFAGRAERAEKARDDLIAARNSRRPLCEGGGPTGMKPWPDWVLWMLFVVCLVSGSYLALLAV